MAKFSLLREELRRALRELRGGRLSPLRGAAAVALGLFVGAQPVFGCHLPIIVFACLWLRLDALIAYVAANISNPLFVAALLTAEVQVGALLRTILLLRFSRALSRADAFAGFAGDLAVGAPVLGLGLAAVGGAVTFVALAVAERLRPRDAPPTPYRLPPDAPPWVQAVERVAGRYAPIDGATAAERSRFHYVRTKLLGDPVAKLVASVEGEAEGALGEVVDVGTGRGQLPILLLELCRATRAHGVDWDLSKVEAARRAAEVALDGSPPLDATFEAGDARAAELPPADTVMLIDVLHYFTIEEQDALLLRAAAAARAGGGSSCGRRTRSVGGGARRRSSRSGSSRRRAITGGSGCRCARPARSRRSSRARGSCARCAPAWGRTPFSNVLIVGRRPR